jgi:hypothetical protein
LKNSTLKIFRKTFKVCFLSGSQFVCLLIYLDADYDDQLDLVELQREMRAEFEEIVAESNVRGRPSIDVQADILAQQLVPPTVEEANVAVRQQILTSPAIKLMIKQLFKRLAKQLLQRNVLSSYDLVDILTLRVSKSGFASFKDAASVLERTPVSLVTTNSDIFTQSLIGAH